MKTYKFIFRAAQVEGISSLWAFKRDGDEDELIPLEISPSGTLVNFKSGGQVVIFPLLESAKKSQNILNRRDFRPFSAKTRKTKMRNSA